MKIVNGGDVHLWSDRIVCLQVSQRFAYTINLVMSDRVQYNLTATWVIKILGQGTDPISDMDFDDRY